MVNPIRIAVVSDLHVGKKARALDLCPHELPPERKISKTKTFIKTFREHVKSRDFERARPIDYLFITGDISDEADPIEFELAATVIQEIAEALSVDIKHIFFVPGNHDVNWPVMGLTPVDFWRKFRYEPLMQEGLIFKNRTQAALTGAFHEAPYFVVWQADHALVIALNTAAFDSPNPEHGKHNGLIRQESLAKLDEVLSNLDFNPSILRVCLLHHHPILYSDLVPNFPDYSALTNAGNLMELLSKHQIDIAVHGHKHVPHLLHSQQTTNGHPVTILGAGSFSAELNTQWTEATHSQFHVIEVEGRNQATQAAFGFVSTWNYEVSGNWRASHSLSGLGATEGFGSMSNFAEIRLAVAPVVDDILAKQGSCPWEEVTNQLPLLIHVNTKVAFDVFDHICKSKALRMFGDVHTVDRAWAILPQRSAK